MDDGLWVGLVVGFFLGALAMVFITALVWGIPS